MSEPRSPLDWTPTVLPAPTRLPVSRIVLPGIDAPLAAAAAVPSVDDLVPPETAAPAPAPADPGPPPGPALGAPEPPPSRAHPPALADVMAQPAVRVAAPELAYPAPARARRAAPAGRNRAASASFGFGLLALAMTVAGVAGGSQADGDLGGWAALFLLAVIPCLVAFIAGIVGVLRPPRGRAAIGLVLSIAANPLIWAMFGGAFG